ncbi:putative peptide-transporting ATPase [Heracleum sosnowskyi]|uniref:Peptide-transporting ATPase n=1 Tax=Heracleum sosnowskyi TaxID=360622 RepID=A0AAD8N5I6_9APIA|nr:putative peptide-transporting ATPase [Heracleum sosnowskyi]
MQNIPRDIASGLVASQKEDSLLNTYRLLENIEEDGLYTEDGTVDYLGNAANRRTTGNWKACSYILGTEFSEKLAYGGMSSNLVLYLKNHLNEHSVTASKNIANWSGTCYAMPLIGAFLADRYLGRYGMIATFSIIYAMGMLLLTLSASVPGLKPICNDRDVCYATNAQTAVFFIALYLVAIGTGGIKPCVSSFAADQFDDTHEIEKKQKASMFNWFYFLVSFASLIAHSVLVWIQVNVGWGIGYGIATGAMIIAVIWFFSGTTLYRNQRPGSSPLTRLCRVIVASLKKRNLQVPSDESGLYKNVDAETTTTRSRKLDHTESLSFFDKAAVELESDHTEGSINTWSLCTVTEVEELKALIRLLPLWATGIIFSTMYVQTGIFFVLQGSSMDTRVGKSSFEFPPASIGIFDSISWILEFLRLELVRRHNYYELDHVPMSIFWQIPQYFIMGCAEVFSQIGQMEFFYDQAPDSMRSIGAALSLSTTALGCYMSSFLVTVVTMYSTRNGNVGWITDNLNYGHLHYFFGLLAILGTINLGVFILASRWFTYKRSVKALD